MKSKPYICLLTFTIVFLTCFASDSFADSGEDSLANILLQSKHENCYYVTYNAQRIMGRMYERGQLDSVLLVLDYVERHCQDIDMGPARYFLNLIVGESDNTNCDSTVYFGIWGYPWVDFDWTSKKGHYHTGYEREYVDWISGLATVYVDSFKVGDPNRIICLYYAGKTGSAIDELHTKSYAGTCYQNAYDEVLQTVKNMRYSNRTHWSLFTGLWIPNRSLSKIGNRLNLGGTCGFRFTRIGWDLVAELRLIKSREPIDIVHDGEVLNTHSRSGLYLGVDLNFKLFETKDFGIELLGGIGYDGISTNKYEDTEEWADAFSLNTGFRTYLTISHETGRYLGIVTKYAYLNYDTNGGSMLSGNVITVSIEFGKLINSMSVIPLERLKYYQ